MTVTNRWRTAVYLALGGALVYAGVSAAGGFSDVYDNIHHFNAKWLLPAVAAVCVRYILLGVQLRLLRGTSTVPTVRLGVAVALVAFGLGGLMPASPLEGFTFASSALHRRGMPRRGAWLMLMASQWVLFWALIVVFAVDRVVVTAAGEVHHRHPLRTVLTSIVLLAITAVAVQAMRRPGIAQRLSRLTRWVPSQRHKTDGERKADAAALHRDLRASIGDRRNLLLTTVLSALCWIADAVVLWSMLRAVHTNVSIGVAIIAYVVAVAVQWVPLLPSGIGLVELAVPALLHHFHVAKSVGLAAVLLWRGVSLVLPALGGFAAWVALRAQGVQTLDLVPVGASPEVYDGVEPRNAG